MLTGHKKVSKEDASCTDSAKEIEK